MQVSLHFPPSDYGKGVSLAASWILQTMLHFNIPRRLVQSLADLAGMEAAISNMLEPGETIVVGNNGIWGQRVCDLAARYGGAPLHLRHTAFRTNGLCCCFVVNLVEICPFGKTVKADLGCPGNVVSLDKVAGGTLSFKEIQDSLVQHKPAVLFLCQVSALMSHAASDHHLAIYPTFNRSDESKQQTMACLDRVRARQVPIRALLGSQMLAMPKGPC